MRLAQDFRVIELRVFLHDLQHKVLLARVKMQPLNKGHKKFLHCRPILREVSARDKENRRRILDSQVRQIN